MITALHLQNLQNFYHKYPFLDIEQLIAYYSIYGGIDIDILLNPLKSINDSIKDSFVKDFEQMKLLIKPSYLMENPYRSIAMAVALGDGRLSNIYRRAKIGEEVGSEVIKHMVDLGIFAIEHSRQAPLKRYSKQLLKKELRQYKIESKVRFAKPFYRFWFAFVEPYLDDLGKCSSKDFLQNYHKHKERIESLLFEQLSMMLLQKYLGEKIVSKGSFWDHHSEFDLLVVTESDKRVLGECKYTSRPITKKELTKLKEKAIISKIKSDTFALFSKSGFSNELMELENKDTILFDLDDFEALLV